MKNNCLWLIVILNLLVQKSSGGLVASTNDGENAFVVDQVLENWQAFPSPKDKFINKRITSLTRSEYVTLCDTGASGLSETTMQRLNDSILLLSTKDDEFCMDKYLFLEYEHLEVWCNLNVAAVVTNIESFFLGQTIFTLSNNQGESIYKKNPHYKNCAYLQARYEQLEVAIDLVESKTELFWGDLTVDQNTFEFLAKSTIVLFLFRGILTPMYFYLSFKSLYYLIERWRLKKRNWFCFTQFVNLVSLLILGGIEARGSHYLDNNTRVKVMMFTYSNFLGFTVSADWITAAIFERVSQNATNTGFDKRSERRFRIFSLVGVAFVFLELFADFSLYFLKSDFFYMTTSIVITGLIFFHTVVMVHLSREMKRLENVFGKIQDDLKSVLSENGAKGATVAQNSSQTHMAKRQEYLYRRFCFWSRVSFSFSILMSLVLAQMGFFAFEFQNQVANVAIYFLFGLCKVCVTFAQVEISAFRSTFDRLTLKVYDHHAMRRSIVPTASSLFLFKSSDKSPDDKYNVARRSSLESMVNGNEKKK